MPTSAKSVAAVNKWEGEDEDDDVKVSASEFLQFTHLCKAKQPKITTFLAK